jgi:hypothetical protein
MNDPNRDAFVHQAGIVEEQGKREYGDHWQSAINALTRKVQDGSLMQGDIVNAVVRPNAAANIFNAGIAEADEQEWRRWRDSQPHRKARIDRCR